jgi:hypothetical protein
MSGIVTLAEASLDHAAGPIAIPIASTADVTLLFHWIFDAVPAAHAPAGARVQPRKVSPTFNRSATNQTSLAHSAPLFTHNAPYGIIASAAATTPSTSTVMFPISDTAYLPTRGCC